MIPDNELQILHKITQITGKLPYKTDKPMMAKKWKCSKCQREYNYNEQQRSPSPCECGSIFFEKAKE